MYMPFMVDCYATIDMSLVAWLVLELPIRMANELHIMRLSLVASIKNISMVIFRKGSWFSTLACLTPETGRLPILCFVFFNKCFER